MSIRENIIEEEKGLSLSDLLFLVKRNIILIVIITGLFTIAGAVYGLKFKKISYTATSTAIVMVDRAGNASSSAAYQDYLTASYLINTFKDFIVSENVVKKVVESNECKDYNLTVGGVKSATSISTTSNSLILIIKYSCYDKQQAIDVVNQLTKSTIEVADSKDSEGNDVYKILAGNFVVMDNAGERNVSASRGASVVIVVSFLIGFIISFAIVLIKYLTDDTYTSKDDFERVYNIDVLSLIPEISEYEKEGGKK